MGLVDDDQGGAAFGGVEIVKGSPDGGDHARGGVRGPVAEVKQQFAIETADTGGGVGEVGDKIAVEIERGGKGSDGSGLTCTACGASVPEPNPPVTRPKPCSRTR